MLSRCPQEADDTACCDEGVTLIELLMSVIILGIVIASVGAAVSVGLRTSLSAETSDRLALSQDAQIASRYFSSDVAGAKQVVIGPATGCGEPTESLLQLRGEDIDRVTVVTSYAKSGTELVRRVCKESDEQEMVVVHNLEHAEEPACLPSPDCQGWAVIDLRLRLQGPGDPVPTDPYTITLTGMRRVS